MDNWIYLLVGFIERFFSIFIYAILFVAAFTFLPAILQSADLSVVKNTVRRLRKLLRIASGHRATAPTEAEPGKLGSVRAHELKKQLDTRVIGQENAKLQLSVLMSMHLAWFEHQDKLHRTPNAVLIGPTGVGKTHTMRVASEHLKVPFLAIDATSLVPSGIVGLQVEDVLYDLVRLANDLLESNDVPRRRNDDIELARRGVIFIDEFDKLAVRHAMTAEGGADTGLVQRRLLKLVEGTILGVGVPRHDYDRRTHRSIDTSGILIVAAGAFAGIDAPGIRRQRDPKLSSSLPDSTCVSADMVSYGLIPELVARFPVVIQYAALEQTDLISIMKNSLVSPINVWTEHFRHLGKNLEITDDAVDYAADIALGLQMGARGLHQIIFPALANIAYEFETSPDQHFIVTPQTLGKRISLFESIAVDEEESEHAI